MLQPRFYVATILLAILVQVVSYGDEPSQIDNEVLADIKGTWRVVAGLADGQKLPEATLRQSYVFVDDQFSVVAGDDVVLTSKLHRLTRFDRIFDLVVEIDFSRVDQTETSGRFKGILRRQDNMLILCTAKVGKIRPVLLSSRIRNGCTLLVMQRTRPAEPYGDMDDDAEDIAVKILTELQGGIVNPQIESQGSSDASEQINEVDKELLASMQGIWQSVSYHSNGIDITADIPPIRFDFEIDGDRYMQFRRHRITGNARISRLVQLNDHIELDITSDDPQKKPSLARAIGRLEDDTLTLCISFKGADRPDEFVSRHNSGLVLVGLQRVRSTDTEESFVRPKPRLFGQKPSP